MDIARHSKPVQARNPVDERVEEHRKETELTVDGVEMGLPVKSSTPQVPSPALM